MTDLSPFLLPFITEVNNFTIFGIYYNYYFYYFYIDKKLFILLIIGYCPAIKKVSAFSGVRSYSGCSICYNIGIYKERSNLTYEHNNNQVFNKFLILFYQI